MAGSIKTRIIIRETTIKILVLLGIGVYSIFFFRESLTNAQRNDYEERIRTIIAEYSQIESEIRDSRPSETDAVSSATSHTEEDLKDTLRLIRKKYENSSLKPYIIDSKGSVKLDYTEDPLNERDLIDAAVQRKNGDFFYTLGGNRYWIFTSYFEQWDWITLFIVDNAGRLASVKTFQFMIIVIVAAAIVISTLITFFFLQRDFSPLKQMMGKLNAVYSGGTWNLNETFAVRRRDEIGQVAEALNSFMRHLREIIGDIRLIESELSSHGSTLLLNMEHVSDSVSTILPALEDLKVLAADRQQKVIESVNASIETISSGSKTLEHNVEEQSAGVNESSASIEEMISNIASVTANVEKVSSHLEKIVEKAGEGRQKVSQSHRQIMDIVSKSEKLLETNKMIAQVSGKTAMLSMNAAIEAAHAGEYGQGFSVVADEIRKLADDSAEESKIIAREIGEIREMINGIADISSDSEATFASLTELITEVSGLEEEVNQAMTEQNTGSSQILEALQEIRNLTSEVKDKTKEIESESGGSRDRIAELISASGKIRQHIESVITEAGRIHDSVESTRDISHKNEKTIQNIIDKTKKFNL